MPKIILFILVITEIFIMIGKVISRLFHSKSKLQSATSSISYNWYGECEKCGKKGGLHRFEGKRYCAMCHARLTAEKKYGGKQKYEN